MRVTFRVPLGGPRRRGKSQPKQFYIAGPVADKAGDFPHPAVYRETADPEKALKITMRVWGNPAENDRIRQAEHEAAGGIRKYMELQAGIRQLANICGTAIERQLWGEQGRPDPGDDEELAEELDQAFADAWDADRSEHRLGLMEIQTLLDRARFRASWNVLVEDPPPGWEVLDAIEMPDTAIGWIRDAYLNAASEELEGNEEPSED